MKEKKFTFRDNLMAKNMPKMDQNGQTSELLLGRSVLHLFQLWEGHHVIKLPDF